MASIVNLAYDLGATVWEVSTDSSCGGVHEAVVKRIDVAVILPATTTITYTIQYVETALGTNETVEANLFADVDSALAEYKLRIT